jgi:hypothetical protein
MQVRISQAKLYKLLADIKGAKFATIVSETVVRMNKMSRAVEGESRVMNELHDLVIKRCASNVTINFIYANAVNNQLKRENKDTDFVPHSRKWGERVEGTSLVIHDNKIYLETKMNGAQPQYVEYYHAQTNRIVEYSEIEPFLPPRKSNAEHQGVAKEIVVRDFLLTSIKEIRVDGVHYIIS